MTNNKLFLRKTIIAGTGLFLCIFLMVHLSANCILLLPEATARGLYNAYSTTLRESPLIKLVAYALYASIILHVFYALLITLRNRKAKPQKYVMNNSKENSTWTSTKHGSYRYYDSSFHCSALGKFLGPYKIGNRRYCWLGHRRKYGCLRSNQ